MRSHFLPDLVLNQIKMQIPTTSPKMKRNIKELISLLFLGLFVNLVCYNGKEGGEGRA